MNKENLKDSINHNKKILADLEVKEYEEFDSKDIFYLVNALNSTIELCEEILKEND
ncbi:hypothetical protein [Aerococcus kribbianus]|uniref:Uncharacterized protein n=1 Tax=Aerococcus kribbianus TaxID=2999064 RepID=A0A9X3JF43_9LACT|nr:MULTISPECIES: hypothetical protein [unclassified Aerococcus]MCZ0717845.1 hypothetical protein [Aerococcus sp. YH-aer221]MCZ0726132.1 hypothetical protein [Aerococcus sp. YH-aer222]